MQRAPYWIRDSLSRLLFDGSRVYALLLGGSILFGGPVRMQAPSYTVIMSWAPYWAWGGSLMVLGLTAMLPLYWVRVASFALLSTWLWVWWAAITAAVLDPAIVAPGADAPPPPGLTGVPTYFALATGYTALAVAMWMGRKEWHDAVLNPPK